MLSITAHKDDRFSIILRISAWCNQGACCIAVLGGEPPSTAVTITQIWLEIVHIWDTFSSFSRAAKERPQRFTHIWGSSSIFSSHDSPHALFLIPVLQVGCSYVLSIFSSHDSPRALFLIPALQVGCSYVLSRPATSGIGFSRGCPIFNCKSFGQQFGTFTMVGTIHTFCG